jgi:hypothetical protein
MDLPSTAWRAREWPKAGRGLPTIRRAAPLDKKGEEGRKGMLSTPHRKEISVASLREKQTGLPRRCAPRNDEVEGLSQ